LGKVLPLRRRIFEDKVSTFWCVLHNFVKVNYWDTDFQFKLCLAATLIFLLPGLFLLAARPSRKQFILSLIYGSMTFYLFSMQVHEKHITMPQIFLIIGLGYLPSCSATML
jgi:alpha-1,3-glucosyltransferase